MQVTTNNFGFCCCLGTIPVDMRTDPLVLSKTLHYHIFSTLGIWLTCIQGVFHLRSHTNTRIIYTFQMKHYQMMPTTTTALIKLYPMHTLRHGNAFVLLATDSPHKSSLVVFFVVILNKVMNKQSNCRPVETPWRSCYVIVMHPANWFWFVFDWKGEGVNSTALSSGGVEV